MILRLFRRNPRGDTIAALYGTIVAQARLPAFYQVYAVPDTVNGRLEMVMLHAVLVLLRLEGEAALLRALGQELFDRFCRDMDDSMREMGVGDLAVPRRMRRIGTAFYGRLAAYRAALERNVFGGAAAGEAALQLAAYTREAARRLAAQDGFARGELAFPDPDQVLIGA
jgi:cytochrome b pre-mRNA-processing protein 3